MQYVRSISGSVSKTWNSINPATLSGAIDVIVVELEDGTLACSPFHIRFGKFSLLRPHEKKVDFLVNENKQDFPLKLAEGGEAFFVFETTNNVPAALQTSPLASPASSPELAAMSSSYPNTQFPALTEPEPLELGGNLHVTERKPREHSMSLGANDAPGSIPIPGTLRHSQTQSQTDLGSHLTLSSLNLPDTPRAELSARPGPTPLFHRASTDHSLPVGRIVVNPSSPTLDTTGVPARPASPNNEQAMTRAINLSKKLWGSNIPSQVNESGDLMLDMTGYKSTDDEALRAEVVARKLLSEELEVSYDIGSLIGADEKGNLWIYSSEEAKEQADRRACEEERHMMRPETSNGYPDTVSDPGYHSDDAASDYEVHMPRGYPQHARHGSDSALGLSSRSASRESQSPAESNRNYAKTLRLTSDQLKTMDLKSGQNTMKFTVNRATCTANLWLWRYDVPIVISDIDGTITKSDALGHVLNMIGRDWTHIGVAKLYTDIASNGYNFLYLTSRSIGQADTTRTYLSGVVQEGGYRLPKGPVILSPDRTIAALRREIYLRKPEIFKMACLRDIMSLFHGSGGSSQLFVDPALNPPHTHTEHGKSSQTGSPFYAGFGNRLTDALSYRSVNIPSTRIFTINSSAEVTLDLLSLNTYKTGYSDLRAILDHYFPPVGLLVKGGGENFTDFNYWRDQPLSMDDFSASESEDEEDYLEDDLEPMSAIRSRISEDEGTMNESFISDGDRDVGRPSLEQSFLESILDEAELDDVDEANITDDHNEDGQDHADHDDEHNDDQDVVGELELEGVADGSRTT